MPLITTRTSLDCDNQRKLDVAKALSKIVAEDIGKPEKYVESLVQSGVAITFDGDAAEGAFVEVKSIGGLNADVNKRLSADICACLKESLGLDPVNVYINFVDVPASAWGWNGGTFG